MMHIEDFAHLVRGAFMNSREDLMDSLWQHASLFGGIALGHAASGDVGQAEKAARAAARCAIEYVGIRDFGGPAPSLNPDSREGTEESGP